jgi:DNA-directed RNA polymerase specialized sigma24 family protein
MRDGAEGPAIRRLEGGGVPAERTTEAPEVFAANLSSIRDILRRVAARQGLSPLDEEQLSSYALMRLAADDYALLRRFQGKSSLRTYLVVVIHSLLRELRHREQGIGAPEEKQSA